MFLLVLSSLFIVFKCKNASCSCLTTFYFLARERNDAVSRLNNEMKNLERLERERREMVRILLTLTHTPYIILILLWYQVSRVEELSAEQQQRKNSADMSRNVGDLNMKLKMEIGALRGENEGLVKRNEEIRREIGSLEDQIQVEGIIFVISPAKYTTHKDHHLSHSQITLRWESNWKWVSLN